MIFPVAQEPPRRPVAGRPPGLLTASGIAPGLDPAAAAAGWASTAAHGHQAIRQVQAGRRRPVALVGWAAPGRRRVDVKALVFRHSLAREAASTIGGRLDERAFVSRFAPVRIEDVGELPLPAGDWVRVETTFSGLCGSDVKQILLNGARDNPLTALVSFPHVLGHEVLGRRADTAEPALLHPWLPSGPPRI